MAEESPARVPCPKCSAKLPWRPEYAGRVATCKACSTKLRMPKSPSEPPQPLRKRSGKQGAAAANRQADSAGDDPFAFLDDEDTDAQSHASAPRPPGGGKRRKRRGHSSSDGGSIKCPGCGANCAPTASSCPACDHSFSPEVLAAKQPKKNRKSKKKREPKERILPEIYILGIGFEKILIALVVLLVVGFFTIPPLMNKIEEMTEPQAFYKVVRLGGADRIEIFDETGQFVNAMDFRQKGGKFPDGVEFQHGGEFQSTIEVEFEPHEGQKLKEVKDREDGENGEEEEEVKRITLFTTVTMNPDVVLEFTGWGPMIQVQTVTYGGKNIRQKYDSGQLSQ